MPNLVHRVARPRAVNLARLLRGAAMRAASRQSIDSRRLALYTGASITAVFGLAGAAAAQSADSQAAEQQAAEQQAAEQQASDRQAPDPDTILVTGSRIRGVSPVGSGVVTLDRDDIVAAGAPSTGDLLRELPSIVALGANETNNPQNFAQNGAANLSRALSVNLRGLGSSATLLLLNGRRMPAAGLQGQITDASVIPSIALERLEVVADGGSAVYGSDAVAGVVNMIPRTRFTGHETTARYGFADGYSDWEVAHLSGIQWNGGRLMIAGAYAEHTELLGKERDFYRQDQRSRGGSDFRSMNCRPGTITPAGSTTTFAIPAEGVTSANASTLVPGSSNRCDNSTNEQILAPLERTSLFGSFEQRLIPGFTLFADGFWSHRTFTETPGSAGGTFTITSANPYYPVGLPGVVGTPDLNVQYDLYPETGPITYPGYSDSWQAVVGLRVDLPAEWEFEALGAYGRSDDGLLRNGTQVNTNALGARGFGGSSDPAVAFNPFGGTNNPSTLSAGRSGSLTVTGETQQIIVSTQADGPLFRLGGGSARMVVGGEYREEDLSGNLIVGSIDSPINIASANDRDVSAVFTEVFLPFVGDANAMPAIGSLNLSLAARYEVYSDFGDTLNPKIGLVWVPLDGLDLRASWGRSFRAPNLDETNPRSSGYGLYGEELPCNHIPGQTTCQGISIAGGNPDLLPEKARTWSAGFDFRPEFLRGFRASATYFDIDYTDQVLTIRGTSGVLTSDLYADYRILNPTAAEVDALLAQNLPINVPLPSNPTFIQDGRRRNVGSTLTNGIDFDVMQVFDVGTGMFDLGIQGTYFLKMEQSLVPGADNADVLGLINYPQQFRARGAMGWRSGPFSARAFVSYVSSYDQQRTPTVVKIDSWTTVDLNIAYDVPVGNSLASGLSFGVNVTNAFDTDPPFVNQSGGYDPQAATAIGRQIALSLRKTW